MQVFKTQPLLVPKVWGGRKLADLFHRDLPDEQPYGESWEVADLAQGQSTIATGEMAGATMRRAAQLHGEALVGTASADGRFPLLVKLLDAAQDLSVQVHPGPDNLRADAQSKDECWLILHTDPEGAVLHGLTREVGADELLESALRGEVLDHLRRVSVSPGDLFRIPPGTIHAICAGVALLEIQQPSDTTYRLYDYARPGLDGLPRDLHLDDAVRVATLAPTLPDDRGPDDSRGKLAPGVRLLANVDAYRIEAATPEADMSWPIAAHTPQVVHVIRGHLCLDDLVLGPADTAVIPAARGRVWLTQPDNCEFVVAGLGGPPLIGR